MRGVVDDDGGLWHRTLDELDACAAAYAARALAEGGGSWVGDPREGVIVLPVAGAGRHATTAAAAGAQPAGLTADHARRRARRERERQVVQRDAAQVGVVEVDVDRVAALQAEAGQAVARELGPEVAGRASSAWRVWRSRRARVSSSRTSSNGSSRTCESLPIASRTPASR